MNLLTIYLFRKVHPTVTTVFGTTPVPVFIYSSPLLVLHFPFFHFEAFRKLYNLQNGTG